MSVNLDDNAREIEKRIQSDIDSWSVWRYKESNRSHLGASQIGHPCMNYLWLSFRWATEETHSGRMYRLFQRGHREEPLLFEMLRGIGFQIYDTDPKTGKQYRVSGAYGHFGGSVDAVGILPERYGIGNVPVLVSCKTSGTGPLFNGYSKGVKIHQPKYYDQENAYGFKMGIQYAVWFVFNKNDDDIHIEIQKLDLKRGEQLEQKAERIIFSREPLGKVSKSPAFKDCSYCQHKEVCHEGALPVKNCRSCKFASPVENAEWRCEQNGQIIPLHVLVQGCPTWNPIVNGEQGA